MKIYSIVMSIFLLGCIFDDDDDKAATPIDRRVAEPFGFWLALAPEGPNEDFFCARDDYFSVLHCDDVLDTLAIIDHDLMYEPDWGGEEWSDTLDIAEGMGSHKVLIYTTGPFHYTRSCPVVTDAIYPGCIPWIHPTAVESLPTEVQERIRLAWTYDAPTMHLTPDSMMLSYVSTGVTLTDLRDAGYYDALDTLRLSWEIRGDTLGLRHWAWLDYEVRYLRIAKPASYDSEDWRIYRHHTHGDPIPSWMISSAGAYYQEAPGAEPLKRIDG